MLKQGEFIQCRIIKEIVLSDNQQCLVVEHDNTRYLIDVSHYKNYQFITDSVIDCKVDKISCSGQVFLEPPHPYYKEGETYFFKIKRIQQNGLPTQNQKTLILIDVFNNEIPVMISREVSIEPFSYLECRVLKISKGKIQLQPFFEISYLEIGKNYKFKIVKTDNETVILQDSSGLLHSLERKYYPSYTFEDGNHITCLVVKQKHDGSFELEPEHPYYRPGDITFCTILSIYQHKSHFAETHLHADVEDEKGFKGILIHSEKEDSITFSLSQKISCKVIKIRRGTLMLQPLL